MQGGKAKRVSRVYDVAGIAFDGSNAHKAMDIEMTEESTNGYINVWAAGCSYCVDIGLLYDNNHFSTITRSKPASD